MSTLRVSNIEAKADASSPSVNEKVKVTNSNGDVLVHINGETSGITTIGINTTGSSFDIDANQNVTFAGIVTATEFVGNLTGDVSSADSIGIGTATSRVSLDIAEKTDAVALPVGTTAQRPASPGSGYMRWNNTSGSLEVYNGSNWIEIVSEYFPEGSGIFG